MISIIIPLYNKECSISSTLRSLLNQQNREFEIIVVDDGSKDQSADIVRSFYDPCIKLFSQENGGPGKARNTGVKHAKGDWILFLDADDELLPHALSVYIDLAISHSDADIIDCGQIIRDCNGEYEMDHTLEGYSKNPMRDWYFDRIGPGSNHSLFKKKFIINYPYNERIRRFEDAELLTRILPSAKVYSSKQPTALVHTEYSSASSARKDINEDFLGYLDISKGGFWYKMCIYKFYVEEREHYSAECHRLYPILYKRFDLLVLYKLFPRLKKILFK